MEEMSQPYLHISPGKINKFAKILSDVMNPVFSGIFVIGLLMFRIIPSPTDAMKWMFITVALTAIPTVTYVLYLVRTGYLVDIYMPEREKRLKPIIVISLWLIISLGILKLIHAPDAMLLMLTAVIVQVGFLGVITVLWKISFHSATIIAVATITAMIPRPTIAGVLIALVPLVGWARVRLKRHTPMQVVAGYGAGFIVAYLAYHFVKIYIPI